VREVIVARSLVVTLIAAILMPCQSQASQNSTAWLPYNSNCQSAVSTGARLTSVDSPSGALLSRLFSSPGKQLQRNVVEHAVFDKAQRASVILEHHKTWLAVYVRSKLSSGTPGKLPAIRTERGVGIGTSERRLRTIDGPPTTVIPKTCGALRYLMYEGSCASIGFGIENGKVDQFVWANGGC